MASTAIPILPQTPPLPIGVLSASASPSPFAHGHPPPSPSPSPSQAHYNGSYAYSPTKPTRTQPNAHPYAIKTTSTALLSRSTSSSANAHSAAHRYVPASSPSPSPSMSPSPTSPTHRDDGRDYGISTSPKREREHQSRATRHRYSRSLTSDMPMPLPPPPGSSLPGASGGMHPQMTASYSTPGLSNPYSYTQNNGQGHGNRNSPSPSPSRSHIIGERRPSISEGEDEDDTPRRKIHQRAETMPQFPLPSLPISGRISAAPNSTVSALPEDPKTWTAEQLAVYVGSMDGNTDINGNVMVKYVRDKQISGRAFLRLAETDLNSLPHATRASFLALSRGLRQKLVRSRIFGTSSTGSDANSVTQDTNDHEQDNTNDDNINFSPIGSLTRQRAIRPRRRSRVDSLGGASDSSLSSLSSTSSLSSETGAGVNAIGGTPRTRKKVKERVEALEKIVLEEEEGTASSSCASSPEVALGHGVLEEGVGAGAGDHVNTKTRTKKSRMPQRGAVTSLFADDNASKVDDNANLNNSCDTRNSNRVNDDTKVKDEHEDKDSTITHLARKNVNGREARMLPFPPTFPPGVPSRGFSSGHGHGPSHPHILGSENGYVAGPSQSMSSPGPGAANSPSLTDDYYGYEFGLRRSVGPGTGPPHNADDPYAGVYVVRHHPSSPRPMSSPGVNAHHTGGSGSGNGNGSPQTTGSSRLLPYPPVVGRAVLHHPRPRRLVGVGADVSSAGNETTSDTGNEVWETAAEEFEVERALGVSGGGEDKGNPQARHQRNQDEEEELSVHELLLREAPSPEKKRTISGVDAWEMELGDTVKRVSGVNGSERVKSKSKKGDGERKTEDGGILRLFDVVSGHQAEAEAEAKRELLHEREELTAHADQISARENDVRAREEEVRAKEENVRIREEVVVDKEVHVRAREEGIHIQGRVVHNMEEDLGGRIRSVEDRERSVNMRETEVEKREIDVAKREDEVVKWEAGVKKKEEDVRSFEKRLLLGEKEMLAREEAVDIRERDATQKEIRLDDLEKERLARLQEKEDTATDASVQTLTPTNVDKAVATRDSHLTEDINSASPKPYLISPWNIKRDWFLGKFRGVFAGAGLGFSGTRLGTGPGGALVLMSLGVCAVVLRVLARRVWGGAAARR